MKKLRTLVIGLLFCVPAFLYAADSDIIINSEPATPAPYEKVTLTLTSYSIDIDNSKIIWLVNGKQISQGVGVKTLTIQTGGAGQNIPILIKVTSPTGEQSTTLLNLTPQSVDLIWETPESYVPPFYEGKSLPGEGADVRLTAIPSISVKGTQVSANNLSYSWYVNEELIGSASGKGKQTAVLGLDYLSTQTEIKVTARTGTGEEASKSVTIYPHKTLPLLYSYDELLGTNFSQQIVRRLETTKDVVVSLVPFFLSARNGLESSTSYSWLLDNQSVTPPEETLLALHPTASSYGSKVLQIFISNSKRRLQDAELDLDVLFDTRN